MMQSDDKLTTNERLRTLSTNSRRFEIDLLAKTQRRLGTHEFTLSIKSAKSLMSHRASRLKFTTLRSCKGF